MPFERTLSQRRDPFGRIDEDSDSGFREVRQRPLVQNVRKLTNLEDNVGRNEPNNRRDVAKVETLMAREGRFDISRTDGPTGIFSIGLEGSIKDFQTDNSLKSDGLITPRGETITSMISLTSLDAEGGEDDGSDNGDGKGGGNTPTPEPKPPPPEPKPEPKDPDGKPTPPKPEPKPDPPPKPKPKPDPPPKPDPNKPDCSDLEVALDNAEAILDQGEAELAAVEAEIAGEKAELESQLANLQQELDAMITAKKPMGIAVTGIGVAAGGIGGGLAGSAISGGIGTLPGVASGAKFGLEAAERAREKIQADIDAKQQEISDIQAQIDALDARLAPLEAAVAEAESLVSEAQIALDACMAAERG